MSVSYRPDHPLPPEPKGQDEENTTTNTAADQSRKRGTLESELLMSTFADANLASMTTAQLTQYDLFLDENDWDIYYWATQEPTPTSAETAEGAGPALATPNAQGKDEQTRQPAKGEWAQTVGTFKPAYRPVPARWKDSEVLALLRKHVSDKSSGGVPDGSSEVVGKGAGGGGGLGMMPEVRNFN